MSELREQKVLMNRLNKDGFITYQLESKSGRGLPDIMFFKDHGEDNEPFFIESKTSEGKPSLAQIEINRLLRNSFFCTKDSEDFYFFVKNKYIGYNDFIKYVKEKLDKK